MPNYDNFILNSDSYKYSHWLQYPPKTQNIFSYIESRGGDYSKTLFFGLQAYIREYLSKPFTFEDIYEAEAILSAHGEPFNKEGWLSMKRKYGGFFPVKICAVPEGSVVPVSNVLVTVEATDPEFYWVTSFLETSLLRAVWYPTTVATVSFMIKQLIKDYLEKTGDVAGLPFKLHDFGARGVSSRESACLGGAAHLINFMGTDTVDGLVTLMRYYDAQTVPGFSIPAAEHSSITSWGKDGEVNAYRNMVKQFGGDGKLLAVVSDSYNIFEACRMWGTELKQDIIDSGTMVVIRPDSGDPATTVLKCLEILGDGFEYTTNTKGYKVLNHVRVIQGDGINHDSIQEILETITQKGWSTDNVAFGMGGALLQHMNRDTQQFAMKCSAALIDGQWVDVFKNPVGDKGKASKKGRLTLLRNGKEFMTTLESEAQSESFEWMPAMRCVYQHGDGKVFDPTATRWTSLNEVRERAESFLR